jgi:dephospho-CoA kinase
MLIGITGNIGSGKSHVAKLLSSITGLPYYDMDVISKVVMSNHADEVNKICRRYGKLDTEHFFTFLRNNFFLVDPLKQDIEELMSGKVWDYVHKVIRPISKHCILESATIHEYKWQKKFQHLFVVTTSDEERTNRLKQRGMNVTKIADRLIRQMDEKYYPSHHFTINNVGKHDYDLIDELTQIYKKNIQ